MIRLARIYLASPGKSFDLLEVLKELRDAVKAAAGVDVMILATMGSQVGEYFSASNYDSLADFEAKGTKILGDARYQAAVKKLDGLVVPGSSRDYFMRQV
jgi:hypothetical protein